MTKQKEIRHFDVEGLEIRAAGEDGAAVLEGYAAVFGKMSEDFGGWREKIKRGAFRSSLNRGDDVVALFNHDPNFVLGRRSANTLDVREDYQGLKVAINLPDTSVGRDLATSVERGDIRKMSFAFFTVEDRWSREDGIDVRQLVQADLVDVSPVTYPAYPDTVVGLRSFERYRQGGQSRALTPQEIDDMERRLRMAEASS